MNSDRSHRTIDSINNRQVNLILWALLFVALLLMVAGIGRALAGEDEGAQVESVPQQRADNLPLATTGKIFSCRALSQVV